MAFELAMRKINMQDIAIRTTGLRKAYRTGSTSTLVLDGIDMEVACGECVFLAGPSGCGKSTLLSILGCVLSADAGMVQVFGQDVTRLTGREQAEFRARHVGFVFQRFHLFRGLSALENVRVPLALIRCPAKTAKARAQMLLEAVGLADKADSSVTNLSIGQRQRVALARALAADPDVILADEPTASLDARSGISAMTLLRDMVRQHGKTVVVVTHDNRIFPMADRILHLDDGRLQAEPAGAGEPALVAP